MQRAAAGGVHAAGCRRRKKQEKKQEGQKTRNAKGRAWGATATARACAERRGLSAVCKGEQRERNEKKRGAMGLSALEESDMPSIRERTRKDKEGAPGHGEVPVDVKMGLSYVFP